MRSLVFASATLSVADDFKHFNHAVGLDLLEPGASRALHLDSSYDFDRNMAVVVAGDLPDPRNRDAYLTALERLLVDVPYPLLGRFEHFLKSAPVRVEDKAFTDTITFTLCVRSADAEAFQRDLVQHTDGRCEPLVMEEFYAPRLEEDNASL